MFRRILPTPRSASRRSPVSQGERHDMRGVITGKDVIRHSVTICRLWGPRCYLRCLRAALSSRPSTFLEIVAAA